MATVVSMQVRFEVKFMLPLLAGVCWLLGMLFSTDTSAAAVSCPDEYRITTSFDNGAGWDLCWQSKQRENIVLSDIHYRNADGVVTKVIGSLRLAQLHVTYDDNAITYNDVTQFGLGGGYVSILDASECPDGELIEINDSPELCMQISEGDDAFQSTHGARLTQTLTLFSISQVGAYSYIVTWKLHDDGSIAPSVGAAGALQRTSDDEASPHGRALEGTENKSWLSHTHNYYWRIDFDLGDRATDDVVSEVSFETEADGGRKRIVTPFLTEAARAINPLKMTAWQVSDSMLETAAGYSIEPLNYGHRHVREDIEDFSAFDFFVTRHNDCERFLSENSKYFPQCGDDILQYVNNESIVDQDIVVWHRISFHHVPRNEDRSHMHSHWDGFVMQSRNLSATTPGHTGVVANVPPVVVAPRSLLHDVNDSVEVALIAHDPDGDPVQYSAAGLPNGIQLGPDGVLRGIATQSGTYRAVVSAADGDHTSSASIQWRVEDKSSGGGALPPLLWMLIPLVFLRHHAGLRVAPFSRSADLNTL